MPSFDLVANDSLIRTDDFLVADTSFGASDSVRFAALSNGGFVAVWKDYGFGTVGRFFDADGNPVSAIFPIDEGSNYDADITVLPDGNIVVSWTPLLSGAPQIYEVHARIFSPAGLPVSDELIVNTYKGSNSGPSHIVALEGGGFAVVWDVYYGGFGDVRVQIFAADGSKVGGEILVPAPVQCVAGGSSIAALTGGGFVVTWNSSDIVNGTGDPTVHGQIFNASGGRIGGILTVNSYAPGNQGAATVTSLPDGGFIVAWNDAQPQFDPTRDGVWFQRFDAAGARVGNEVHVTDGGVTTGFMRLPSVEVIPGTGFLVVWQQSDTPNAWIPRLFGQLYDFNGQPIGTEFGLATDVVGTQSSQNLELLEDGQVIVGWLNSVSNPDDADFRAQFLYPLIRGTAGDDVLAGTDHRDFISGGTGNDQIDGGAGADTLIGGAGNDVFIVDNAGDVIAENPSEGTDTVNSSVSHTLEAEVENLTLTGSAPINGTGNALNNVITGNSGANVIDGAAGNDTLDGGGGIDTASYASAASGVTVNLSLVGAQNTIGAGTDSLANFENLLGSSFADNLTGDGADNVIEGGAGNDTLNGGLGADTLSYVGATAGVTVNLGLATAQNTVGAGNDTVSNFENVVGSAFGDTLTGGSGANVLTGLGGDDKLDGAGGDDTLDGGAGSDTASYIFAAGAVTVNLSVAGAQNTLGAGVDMLVSIENLTGSGLNDTLTGNSGNNVLTGGAGNDTLDGGTGTDTASYAGAASGVTVNLSLATAQNTVGAGTDTLSNLENLLGSSFADTLTGDGNANVIEGGAGNDTLNGGAGIDTLSYAGAASAVTVNLATTMAQNTVGAGIDTVSNFENLLGSGFNDALTGNSGNNVIEGGAGNDTLNGGNGTDTASYASAASAVTVNLTLGGQWATGGAGDDALSNFENVLGSAFNDTLTGNNNANVVDGGAGNDFLQGNGGADTLTGGGGADRFWGTRDDLNGVTITDFAPGDTLNFQDASLDNFTFSLVGNVLTYTGGSLTLQGPLNGTLVASLGATGGVALSLTPGTEGDDNLIGTDQPDVLNALGGNDVINGLGGSDTLTGGSGNDRFQGTAADLNGDTITDLQVGDTIVITDAALGSFSFALIGNVLNFSGGSMTLSGSLTGALTATAAAGGGVQLTLEPNETLIGTEQANIIDGHGGNDTIDGLGGNDLLIGGDGADIVNGGSGEDQISSGPSAYDQYGPVILPDNALDRDVLSAGADNDYIWAGYGDDIDGGSGIDALIYSFGGLSSGITLNTSDILTGQPHVFAGGTIQNVENLIGVDGTAFADTITVVSPNVGISVRAGGGDDLVIAQNSFIVSVSGGDGNDRFVSGTGADDFWGDAGIDTIDYVNSASGVTVTLGNPGNFGSGTGGDSLRDVENAFGSAFGDTLNGANTDNWLNGFGGNDTLSGNDGNDTLTGGTGIDSLTGGAGNDSFRDTAAGLSGDTITDFGIGDKIVLSDATLAGFSFNLTGNTLTYTGGSVTLSAPVSGTIVATAAAGGGVQLAVVDTQFGQANLVVNSFGAGAAAGGWTSNNVFLREVADVNGDDRADIIAFGQSNVYVALANNDGSFAAPVAVSNQFTGGIGWANEGRYPREMADVNGDGRADIVGFGEDGVYVSIANTNGTFAAATLPLQNFGASGAAGGWTSNGTYLRTLADVNGDGRADIVAFGQSSVYVALGTANGGFLAPMVATTQFTGGLGWANENRYPRELADVNGDGRADIVAFGENGVYVALGNANGTFANATLALQNYGAGAASGGWTSNDTYLRTMADVDGDGRADIVAFGQSNVFVSLSIGDGTFTNHPGTDLFTVNFGWTSNVTTPRILADVNGDGAADIVGFGVDGTYVALSYGDVW